MIRKCICVCREIGGTEIHKMIYRFEAFNLIHVYGQEKLEILVSKYTIQWPPMICFLECGCIHLFSDQTT